MPDLLLAIDTAFERCSAGILDLDTGKMRARAEPEIGKGHAEQLMGIVETVLAEAGAGYADLRRIGVAAGPGSFTGIRVGVAAARGLALALDIPAIGIDTLEALAASHLGGDRPILSVLDARRGELYAELFHSSGISFAGPAAVEPGALAGFVAPIGEGPLDLVGTGAGIAGGALGERAGKILSEASVIDIEILARLAALQEPDGPPAPIYLRGADAKPASAARGLFAASESIL
ncbi:tRNA (adenosine(37)-N6)-threonylcarbamoyltransferase complex dimerization subunit type 1 TsaB [Aurantimonas sp. VKM B-3413]|uniref:tRNA (adenosine(37)-N6)-threonylcarbamoyltransferase complex dimerization subunit type 1 TsaB n=1 Tax=Aurantimonas sp. VKM B-3413 TaxID=2779401 RepID=UPI001E397FEA|nr:tRNA (adenosine(37)-N6)-threonylcarbamoyltransferase complex dimerization subunit type 1 TsaB [Aurantimonas sp. VKM B-3413]MCB8840812.1 tRNA (adenosine(37)-N6)-threonylcarbamoyltransferase complex dimerization subunit type 1 TsaB [Aurantimonas sp. VKM B-3413]